MKRLSPYLKNASRVRSGAIEDLRRSTSVVSRIRHVSEHGLPGRRRPELFRFTWRTIQTWYSRYKKDGVTSMRGKVPARTRSRTRKMAPEEILEAIEQVRGSFRGTPNG